MTSPAREPNRNEMLDHNRIQDALIFIDEEKLFCFKHRLIKGFLTIQVLLFCSNYV